MLITLEPHGIFGSNFACLFILALSSRSYAKIVGEYNQEMPQSQTADKPIFMRIPMLSAPNYHIPVTNNQTNRLSDLHCIVGWWMDLRTNGLMDCRMDGTTDLLTD